jgi:mono/diheme cytochrome c family protein
MLTAQTSQRTALFAALLLASFISPAHSQDVAEGRAFAEKNCARCHSIAPTGKSAHPAAPPFRDIAAKGRLDDLQEALAEGITVGHADMPEFELTPEQITSLLGYLKQLAPRGN